ncbi:MAG: quinoprotein dehydrogenase-associated putative ABC transporter substrate-binding protein [Methylococcus sp.]|jgi:quinoprotein dehydrogenase-associated probable ABC transporter substrate-binding protein|nr:MAG: quinoprotein dehydrogenase-associated putative ABC transporter substrate-binding protein [Methylococcus sp.]
MMHVLRFTVMAGFFLLMTGLVHADGEVFKVCADPNNPPLSLENGKGYENKIANLIADALGQKLEYTWFPQRLGFIRNTLKAKLPDSESYKCDVVMGVPDGFEIAATTRPYYRSTYVLVLVKGGALDAVKAPNDLDRLPQDVRSKLRIAMFDGAPGTTWLLNHGLMTQGIPYQTMTGDTSENAAQVLLRDFTDKKLDMVILWGPMAAYLSKEKPGMFEVIPMISEPGLRFDFAMSMGVRIPDKERKKVLDDLIEKKGAEIEAILKDYGVPLLPLESAATKPH